MLELQVGLVYASREIASIPRLMIIDYVLFLYSEAEYLSWIFEAES